MSAVDTIQNLLTLGVQTIFGSFFLGILTLGRK